MRLIKRLVHLVDPVTGRMIAEVPFAHFGRRRHHQKCPTHPGEVPETDTICCDCIYGTLAEKTS